jgi:hypothetical protein
LFLGNSRFFGKRKRHFSGGLSEGSDFSKVLCVESL